MAGQPKKRVVAAELERRAQEIADERTPSPTILDYAEHYVSSGSSLAKLADEIGGALGMDVQREMVRRLVYACDEERAEERLTRARTRGADGLAEQAVDLIDLAPLERDAISKARAQSEVRQWLASRWNRERYGDSKAPSVVISIGSLHLDALRARPAHAQLAPVENGSGENHLELTSGDVAQVVGIEELM